MKKLIQRIKCFFDVHDNYDWYPYPSFKGQPPFNHEIKVQRCKVCDNYHWRER